MVNRRTAETTTTAAACSVVYLVSTVALVGLATWGGMGQGALAPPLLLATLPTAMAAIIITYRRLRPKRIGIAQGLGGLQRVASPCAERREWHLRIAVATGAVVLVQVGCEIASLR